MKFECGIEKEAEELQALRAQGIEISLWEKYREHNRQELPLLLTKRSQHAREMFERKQSRITSLLNAIENGIIIMKI